MTKISNHLKPQMNDSLSFRLICLFLHLLLKMLVENSFGRNELLWRKQQDDGLFKANVIGTFFKHTPFLAEPWRA